MGTRLSFGALALVALGCEGTAGSAASSAEPSASVSASPSAAPPAVVASASADAADAAPPDTPLALPWSDRLAAKLKRSADDSLAYARRYVFEYGGGRMQLVDDTFVVVAGEKNAPFDDAMKMVHETDETLSRDLAHRPTTAATVWVFGTRKPNYEQFVPFRAGKDADARALSFYVPIDNIVRDTSSIYFCAEGQGNQGLRHEVAHHWFRADFPRAPTWLAEGAPALFEFADPAPDGQIHAKAHMRLQTLRTALTKPAYAQLVRLDVLFSLRDDESYRKNEALSYALAREFLRWADSKSKLWPFYRLFRDGVLTDETGEKAFAATFDGKTPAEATGEFLDWVGSPQAE
jgi:hypothetical protein